MVFHNLYNAIKSLKCSEASKQAAYLFFDLAFNDIYSVDETHELGPDFWMQESTFLFLKKVSFDKGEKRPKINEIKKIAIDKIEEYILTKSNFNPEVQAELIANLRR